MCNGKTVLSVLGLIPLQKLFEAMEDSRTVFTDSLLELLGNNIFSIVMSALMCPEIEHDGRINFSSFLLMVVTYCLFEPQEVLKCIKNVNNQLIML